MDSGCHAASVFSVTLQIEIFITVTSDFLKRMIILKSFNSMLHVIYDFLCTMQMDEVLHPFQKYFSQIKKVVG